MNMNKCKLIIAFLSIGLISCQVDAENILPNWVDQENSIPAAETIPPNVQELLKAYPNELIGYADNQLIFKDSSMCTYDDNKSKTDADLINHPDIKDMFKYVYKITTSNFNKRPDFDPGRIRNELFFDQMYGKTELEVRSNLVEVIWCPKLVNQVIRVTKINGVNERFLALSQELDMHPEFKGYLKNIGGTFNYRIISGTSRRSMHSYGMTIDLNVSQSNYWQWDCKCKDESKARGYRNQIPYGLVKIFEKHGFIWGGAWKHYDTMHFEYRPELL